jgi:hypothetical protein
VSGRPIQQQQPLTPSDPKRFERKRQAGQPNSEWFYCANGTRRLTCAERIGDHLQIDTSPPLSPAAVQSKGAHLLGKL